jgi:hypothetical protein
MSVVLTCLPSSATSIPLNNPSVHCHPSWALLCSLFSPFPLFLPLAFFASPSLVCRTHLSLLLLCFSFSFSTLSADHNQYIHNGYSYQSNYCAGLRVLDISQMTSGELSEKGFFDVAPECNKAVFSGTWSNYPYFSSGTIAVQSIEKGLFLLKVLSLSSLPPSSLPLCAPPAHHLSLPSFTTICLFADPVLSYSDTCIFSSLPPRSCVLLPLSLPITILSLFRLSIISPCLS